MPLWLLIFIGFLIVSFVVLMALTFWYSHSSYRKERQKFAEQNGLHVKRTSNDFVSLWGTYRGRQVQIEHVHGRRSPTLIRGTNRGRFLKIQIVVKNAANLTFVLEPYNLRWKDIDGLSQLETGSRKFDEQFFLAGNPANSVLKLFDSVSFKNELLKEADHVHRGAVFLELEKGLLVYEHYEHSSYSNAMQLQFLIDLLSDLADEIDSNVH